MRRSENTQPGKKAAEWGEAGRRQDKPEREREREEDEDRSRTAERKRDRLVVPPLQGESSCL